MQLIGMLDSPYVRRTAISLRLLGIPFEHMPLSVFRDFDRVHAINPLVKVPTLVCDDGLVLVDSTLIIDYAESIANQRLMPAAAEQHRAALRLIGVALAACEKSVQIFYERRRAADHRDAAWMSRIGSQLQSACKLLERELRDDGESAWLFGEKPMQADITIAVAWGFAQLVAADVVLPADYPKLVAFGARAERLPEFQAFPID